MEAESIGNQSYQAGTVEFTHRATHGLTLQANYTFAKNISDAQGTDARTAYDGEERYAVEIAKAYNIKYDRGNVVGMPRQRSCSPAPTNFPSEPADQWPEVAS